MMTSTAPTHSSPKLRRLELLGAYRAVAALLISFSHLAIAVDQADAEVLEWVRAIGRIGGVDFFFVLSGYLIHRAYARRVGQGYSTTFLRRRLLRIYPLVWVFTLLSLPVYWVASNHGWGDGHEFEVSRLVRSFMLWPDTLQPILGATWSLRHVVAFYLVFALFLRWPVAVRRIVVLWAAAVALWAALHLPLPGYPEYAFVLSPFNLAFLWGAWLSARSAGCRLLSGGVWILAGVLLFAFTWMTGGELGQWDAKLPLYGMASAALILGAETLSQQGRVNVPAFVEHLGDASFAMIVVNLPVLLATAKLLGAAGLLTGGHVLWAVPSMMLAVVVASIATHRVIEQPLTRWLSAQLDRIWPHGDRSQSSMPHGRYRKT